MKDHDSIAGSHHHHHHYSHNHRENPSLDSQQSHDSDPKPTRRRRTVKRRQAETHIPGRRYRDPQFSFSNFLPLPKGPSINPVRRSVEDTPDNIYSGFVIHFHRKLHSHLTVDSLHESYYKKHGLPTKPRYDMKGRRFSGSSDTDPDYNHEQFKKLAAEVNAAESPEDEEDDVTISTRSTQSSAASSATDVRRSSFLGSRVHPSDKRMGSMEVEGGIFYSFKMFIRTAICCCLPWPHPVNSDLNFRRSKKTRTASASSDVSDTSSARSHPRRS